MAQLPPQRVPLTRNDMIEREWLRFFSDLSDSTATTTDVSELQASIDALQAELDELATAEEGASGTTEINFGAFPGGSDASVFVSDAGIAGNSVVNAWLMAVQTADHSPDEHFVEALRVTPGNVQAGTGFTVYGAATGSGLIHGAWSIGWERN